MGRAKPGRDTACTDAQPGPATLIFGVCS